MAVVLDAKSHRYELALLKFAICPSTPLDDSVTAEMVNVLVAERLRYSTSPKRNLRNRWRVDLEIVVAAIVPSGSPGLPSRFPCQVRTQPPQSRYRPGDARSTGRQQATVTVVLSP